MASSNEIETNWEVAVDYWTDPAVPGPQCVLQFGWYITSEPLAPMPLDSNKLSALDSWNGSSYCSEPGPAYNVCSAAVAESTSHLRCSLIGVESTFLSRYEELDYMWEISCARHTGFLDVTFISCITCCNGCGGLTYCSSWQLDRNGRESAVWNIGISGADPSCLGHGW